ncbi:MAG: class II SORL domain-containing protein [Phycisphaerae bacterium]
MPQKNLFVGVNEPEDMNDLSDLEKKHIPVIEAPDSVKVGQPFTVNIEVGKLKDHPNEHKHWIEFIDLYADDTFICRADFRAQKANPKMTCEVMLEGPAKELCAYENCNMHGTWVGRKSINVQ